jgi:hypothetical protein
MYICSFLHEKCFKSVLINGVTSVVCVHVGKLSYQLGYKPNIKNHTDLVLCFTRLVFSFVIG